MADEPKKPDDKKSYPLPIDKPWSVTQHKLGKLSYTATVGMMPLNDEFGETQAGIFFMAYTKDGVEDSSKRNLMFSFNGGPGSSSVWLHLGAVGPKRVILEPDGNMPAPPYALEDNELSWLEDTDLVFIDPVGTGYSRPAKEDGGKKYWSLEGDIESIGEFIRMYLSRSKRWTSPIHLVGESYGTTRAAGLSSFLLDSKGIALNSIVLVSSILNFQTARFHKGNDLPYQVFLPTYAAAAFYHGKSGYKTLREALEAAEKFAAGEYVLALSQGSSLSAGDRKKVISQLVKLTGLSADYIESTDLRVDIHRFCKELLRKEKRTVGRLDSRYIGIDANSSTDQPDHDPSMTAIMAPYTTTLNQYLSTSLGWESDTPYYIFNPGELWKNWSYGDASHGHPDTSECLRAAMSKNPFMKVFIASGYYDLATPYFATEFTLDHLGLDPSLRKNIETQYYEAGHMMYVHTDCLAKLKKDVSSFLKK